MIFLQIIGLYDSMHDMFTLSRITFSSIIALHKEWAAEFSDAHTVVPKPDHSIDKKVDKVWRALSVARKTGEVWLRAESEWLTPAIVKVEGSVKWWVDHILNQNWKKVTSDSIPEQKPVAAQLSSTWSTEEQKARLSDAADKKDIAHGNLTAAQEDLRTKADAVAKTHVKVDELNASILADMTAKEKLSYTALSESVLLNKQISPERQLTIDVSWKFPSVQKIKSDATNAQNEIIRKSHSPLTPEKEKSVIDFCTDKKDMLLWMIMDQSFSDKLIAGTITAQELLDNPIFVKVYWNTTINRLSEVDIKDYENFKQIIELADEATQKDDDLTYREMELEQAEIDKQNALSVYMDSAVWIRTISDEYNEALENFNTVKHTESDPWEFDINNDWNKTSIANIADHPDGYQMLLEWDNTVGGSNMYVKKQWDNLILTFSNGDTFRIDGQWEDQMKQIEFIRSLNDIPTMRMLIGMWANNFSEFSKMLATKNPMATMENPKIFINNTMQILGWVIGESENDMPKDFSIWKEIDQWIRDYMTPTRTEDWRKTLKATGIMKEDNNLETYTFMESAKRIIL